MIGGSASSAVFFLLVTTAGAGVTQTRSGAANVNTTRMEQFDDIFTNPNRMTVLNCAEKGQPANPASCEYSASSPTNAHCQTKRDCCNSCQCNRGFPTYLRHLARCVTDLQFSSVLQNQGMADCDFRLSTPVTEGRWGASHDEDHEDLCKLSHWFPTFDLETSLNVHLCHLSRGVKMTSCSVSGGRFLHLGQWRYIANAPNIFPIHRKGKLFVLKPKFEARRYEGYVISLEIACPVTKGKAPVSSCVTFKSAGIQTVLPPITPVSSEHIPTIPYTTTVTTSTGHSNELFNTSSSTTLPLINGSLSAPESSEQGSVLNTVALTRATLRFGRRQEKRDATAIFVPVLCGTFSIAVFVSVAVCLARRIKSRRGVVAKSRNEVSSSPQFYLEPNETSEHPYEQPDTVIPALAPADGGSTALKIPSQPSLYQPLHHDKAQSQSGRSSSYATLKSGRPTCDERSSSTYNEQKDCERTDIEDVSVYQDLSGRTEDAALEQKRDLHDGRMYQSLVQSGEVQSHCNTDPYYLAIHAPDEYDTVEGPYYYKLEPDS